MAILNTQSALDRAGEVMNGGNGNLILLAAKMNNTHIILEMAGKNPLRSSTGGKLITRSQ